MESSKLHAALLSSPGMGHLVPILELAKLLVNHHHLQVTVLVVTTHSSPAETQLVNSIGSELLHIIELPPVDISGVVHSDAAVATRLAVMMSEARPEIRSALSAMKPRPNMLVVDIFGTESFEIADELRVPSYVFATSTAWLTALTVYCPVLDKEIEGQYVDEKESLRLPGCKPVRPEDVVDPMLDRNDQQYREFVRIGVEFARSDGILMNTWDDLERQTIEALRGDDILLGSVVKPPVYPVGPLTKPVEPGAPNRELLDWLDEQPGESVLYVSFGTGGTLSAEQITELAWGLELSRQRFIWVVRPPVEGHADASFFTSGNVPDGGTPDFLPDGFFARTHKVGLVVPLWAPQMKILSHPSVGGFLFHGGWNSTLESLTNGVPMIVWPLYAEQRLNATMLTEELGVAVRPKALPTMKTVVRREEIAEMVRSVMEHEQGKAMRKRMMELKNSGEKAQSKDGSSYKYVCQLINDCQRRLKSRE